MNICTLAARYGVKGPSLRKQYKELISGYRSWDQLSHAEEYLLFPENVGDDLSLDETCLSNGEVYTVLTNKAARGRKGALVSIVRGVSSDTVSSVLFKIPPRDPYESKEHYHRPFLCHDADSQEGLPCGQACQ